MADSRVASRYVKSLLSLAVEQGALEEVHRDMQMLDRTCENSRDFLVMLRSPVVKHDKKREVLIKLFKGRVHKLSLAILDIITRKNREPLLPSIAKEFHNAYNTYSDIGRASVTTSMAIDPALRSEFEKLVKKLNEKNKIELNEKVDPSLIGGFILNVGDWQIDSSIKSKLKSLRMKFSYNPYIKEY